MTVAARLHKAVAQIVPDIVGVSIGDIGDRGTWRVHFQPGARVREADALRIAEVIAGLSLEEPPEIDEVAALKERVAALEGEKRLGP